MQPLEPLDFNKFYHIYNRGINGENLFKETTNFEFFLQLYHQHIDVVVETYCFCLMKNHFHFLVKIKPKNELIDYSKRHISPIYSMPIQKLSIKNTTDTAPCLKDPLKENLFQITIISKI